MTKETLDQQLEKGIEEYKNENITAFLGDSGTGKTVVASLFNYHLINKWIPNHSEKWAAANVKGSDFFFELVRKMKQGEFPDTTAQQEFPELVVEVFNMGNFVSKQQIRLFDMSGEKYVELLHKELDVDQRLSQIKEMNADYLIFATHYVIMIGCDSIEEWETDIAKIGHVISAICQIKRRIHKLNENKKIDVPISIVFTKSDLIDDNIENSSEKLLEKYPILQTQLNTCHDERYLKCFKLYVKGKKETLENAENRVKEKFDRDMEEYQQSSELARYQYNGIIKLAVDQAKKTFEENEEKPEKTLEEVIKNAQQKAELKNNHVLNIEQPVLQSPKPDSIILSPFEYSADEYGSLITWIINSNVG